LRPSAFRSRTLCALAAVLRPRIRLGAATAGSWLSTCCPHEAQTRGSPSSSQDVFVEDEHGFDSTIATSRLTRRSRHAL
jgi:hypothetical protein